MRPLYKTTLVIWSDSDLSALELDALGQEATEGDAYCSSSDTVLVDNPETDPNWDGTEFFNDDTDEEEGD